MVDMFFVRLCASLLDVDVVEGRVGVADGDDGDVDVRRLADGLVVDARVGPNDVCVVSARPYGHRAVLKFASNTGAQAIAGRFTMST
jgi:hypothetical protein